MIEPARQQTGRRGEFEPAVTLSSDFFTLLVESQQAFLKLPHEQTDTPEAAMLATAVSAGPARARRLIEGHGSVLIASALMEASATFRATGHFRQASMMERTAFVISGWERRRRSRKRA